MFRIFPGIQDVKTERTFERVRTALEPTLYVLRYEVMFNDQVGAVDLPGSVYPIPYHILPESGNKEKAWQRGNLVIDHMSCGVVSIVTAEVFGIRFGAVGVTISLMVCDLGGAIGDPQTLKWFDEEQKGLDLSEYDAIGLRYTLDNVPGMNFGFASSLLWRPSL